MKLLLFNFFIIIYSNIYTQTKTKLGFALSVKTFPMAVSPEINFQYVKTSIFCSYEFPLNLTGSLNFGFEQDLIKIKTLKIKETYFYCNAFYSIRKSGFLYDFDEIKNDGWKIQIDSKRYLDFSLGIKSYDTDDKKDEKLKRVYANSFGIYFGYKYALTEGNVEVLDPGINSSKLKRIQNYYGSYPYFGLKVAFALNFK